MGTKGTKKTNTKLEGRPGLDPVNVSFAFGRSQPRNLGAPIRDALAVRLVSQMEGLPILLTLYSGFSDARRSIGSPRWTTAASGHLHSDFPAANNVPHLRDLVKEGALEDQSRGTGDISASDRVSGGHVLFFFFCFFLSLQ